LVFETASAKNCGSVNFICMKPKDTPIKNKAASDSVMNLKDIESLIKFVQGSGVAEVSLEQKDFKITIKTTHGGMMIQSSPPVFQSHQVQQAAATQYIPAASAASSQENIKKSEDSKYTTIKSPMIGTFYRSANPEKPVFVNVGDEIKQGQVLCIIEAMKLFNEIESEVSGKIVKVLVDNATPVEYDQPLFLIDPS
jgi:acetyl-CoA carboxylase biotin carboxyl carrier protein